MAPLNGQWQRLKILEALQTRLACLAKGKARVLVTAMPRVTLKDLMRSSGLQDLKIDTPHNVVWSHKKVSEANIKIRASLSQ